MTFLMVLQYFYELDKTKKSCSTNMLAQGKYRLLVLGHLIRNQIIFFQIDIHISEDVS